MEYFLKYQTIILRTLGAVMLVIGFSMQFWTTPKEGISANTRAAANVARLEAHTKGSASAAKAKNDNSKYLDKLKDTQAQQMKYLTIFLMLFGIGFLGYSFFKKDEM